MPYCEEIARRLAEQYHTNNPEYIAKELGIKIMRVYFQEICGISFSLGSHKFIMVNHELPEAGQRLVIGHELGHFVLHPTENFIFLFTKTLLYNQYEYQANLFSLTLQFNTCNEYLKELATQDPTNFLTAILHT